MKEFSNPIEKAVTVGQLNKLLSNLNLSKRVNRRNRKFIEHGQKFCHYEDSRKNICRLMSFTTNGRYFPTIETWYNSPEGSSTPHSGIMESPWPLSRHTINIIVNINWDINLSCNVLVFMKHELLYFKMSTVHSTIHTWNTEIFLTQVY